MDERARQRNRKVKDPSKGGHPTKFTDDTKTAILNHLKLGGYMDDACAIAGVTEQTVYEWIARGTDEEERRRLYKTPRQRTERVDKVTHRRLRRQNQPFVDWKHDVTAAQSLASASMLGSIAKAATGGALKSTTTTSRTLADGSIEKTVVEERTPPDWKAAAWRLERRQPKKWSREQRLEVKTEVTADDDYLEALTQGLNRAAGLPANAGTDDDDDPETMDGLDDQPWDDDDGDD